MIIENNDWYDQFRPTCMMFVLGFLLVNKLANKENSADNVSIDDKSWNAAILASERRRNRRRMKRVDDICCNIH